MNARDERERVAEAHGALAVTGQSDMVWGHVSGRAARDGAVLMKRAGLGFEEVTADDVLLVSDEGQVLEGTGDRHIEYPIHVEILRARPDVNAVVHTHSAAAAAFASLDVPLRPLTHDAVPFLTPDIPRFLDTGDLISTAELGQALADSLGAANGVLIPGHGLVVVGDSLASAVMHAALLDRACRVQLDAMAAGGPKRWSDEQEVAHKREHLWTARQLQAGYDYLVRAARRG
ncbi:class II aldolase/adducin family protein [Microbacterium sp. RD1]|uniref:class II aldolase/adducin family protein n=1 Tax=Microbacterium sp. RD1 TaxID=3457313 RepID=UPI003FA55FCB